VPPPDFAAGFFKEQGVSKAALGEVTGFVRGGASLGLLLRSELDVQAHFFFQVKLIWLRKVFTAPQCGSAWPL
jgi:hypothetical protein